MKHQCSNCAFYVPFDEDKRYSPNPHKDAHGVCRFNPPVWPTVCADWWCGQFREVEPKPSQAFGMCSKREWILREALAHLYQETANYITINNLGDVHHNQSMQKAKAALDLP